MGASGWGMGAGGGGCCGGGGRGSEEGQQWAPPPPSHPVPFPLGVACGGRGGGGWHLGRGGGGGRRGSASAIGSTSASGERGGGGGGGGRGPTGAPNEPWVGPRARPPPGPPPRSVGGRGGPFPLLAEFSWCTRAKGVATPPYIIPHPGRCLGCGCCASSSLPLVPGCLRSVRKYVVMSPFPFTLTFPLHWNSYGNVLSRW